jgi:hypothetical protein
VPKEVNQRLADFYASKQPFTKGKTVRDWLNGRTFKEQYDFGRKQMDKAMKEYEEHQKKH